ncbi:(Fe-S)-binding protein [Sulfobacillus thermosulfidooxidans]|uniref:(Fe-S)-binding protein n=1 Tax=Sulfobacillus thermosulfidooxidans TaxID=28034 RepID=UPI0002D96BBB|nr:heterodisulfide reductase-related iron-sulfur binding cluster [Sulfobacillus thermosulfidooxidans]
MTIDAQPSWMIATEDIEHCNKCGFCLPVCPTYQLTSNELQSPRGRIAMIEAAIQGEISIGEGLDDSLSHCLDCRACETACPSGVRYHRILETGRDMLRSASHSKQRSQLSFATRQILKLVKKPQWFRGVVRVGNRFKKISLPKPLESLKPFLGYTEQQIAKVTLSSSTATFAVEFFEGCIMSAQFADANQAAKNLLARGGIQSDSPAQQGCCGALHLHSGYAEEAKAMARQNIDVFLHSEKLIVNTAGGCGAMLMQYGELLADDPKYADKARQFSARVRDWATVFNRVQHKVPLRGSGKRVTLQNSCHLVNVEHAGQDTVDLLKGVTGDLFVPYSGQDSCCGSAGTYNIEQREWAMSILEQKMIILADMQPDLIIVNNPGCHFQMRWGVQRYDWDADRVQHLAVYLERAAQRAERMLDQGECVDA